MSKTQKPVNKAKANSVANSLAIKKNSNSNCDNADNLTPKQIVEELDRYIIGQKDAKKAVAIALRNRYRRKMVESPLREEIVPKNILCIGPTGVGKTEIARRLAKLANAPFIKVEATKFTEVGYVGRDVDSIIRDLIEVAIKMVKQETKKEFLKKSEINAKDRIVKILVGNSANQETKDKFLKMLEEGGLDDKEIEIEVTDNSQPNAGFEVPGGHIGMINIGEMISKAIGGEKTRKMKTTVAEGLKILTEEEGNTMVDQDKIIKIAIKAVENDGIVFIDEFDKICNRGNLKSGDVSR